jgi:hypothetical protein
MINPVAQTFFVDSSDCPQGIFVSSIDICFKKRDNLTFMPFTLQLRPTVNGFPHASTVYPFGQVSLQSSQIIISDYPNLDYLSGPSFTRFTFPTPVYLVPGEHAIVLSTNSDQYEVYVAQIGQTMGDGSERLISQQPYTGSFFKSQNGSTYTPYQDIDLMFRVNRCDFSYYTSNTASFTFNDVGPSSEVYADVINIGTQDLTFKNTEIDYYFEGTDNTSSVLSSFTPLKTQTNIQLNNRIKIDPTGNTFILRANLSSTDANVSPMIDLTRLHLIAVENIINDGGLKASDFTITNSGSGYTANASITLSGSTGSGANAYAVVANGNVVSVIVDSVGSGYLGSITGTIAAPSVPSGNTTATISIANELAAKGGNGLARYITRRVTLNDGFDASNLRIYIDAVNLAETDITVYYKILSAEDPDLFDNRPYVVMQCVQQGNETLLDTAKSQHDLDYREYLYVPTTTTCSYVGSNGVTYNNYKTFAIKIVMTSSDTTKVPRIKNFRSIALNN